MVTMVWVVIRFRLKGPSWYLIFIYISPLTSLGQRSRAPWAPQPQKSATLSPQPGGKTTKFVRTGGGIGGKKKYLHYFMCFHGVHWDTFIPLAVLHESYTDTPQLLCCLCSVMLLFLSDRFQGKRGKGGLCSYRTR